MSAFPPPPGPIPGLDPTAVMGRRIGAYIVDVIIGWVVIAAVFWSVSTEIPNSAFLSCTDESSPTLCLELGDTIRFAEGGDATLVVGSGIAVWMLMSIVVQGLTGGTPGKLMVGLRVVRGDDGQLAGLGRCAARSLMWIVDAAPYGIPLVGLITAASTKGHRRVGDMVAGSLVVRASSVGTPPVVAGLTVAGAPAWSPAPPVGTAGPGGWVPPTGPPVGPPQSSADPFASPPGEVFPSPTPTAPPGADSPTSPPPVAPPVDQPQWDPQHNAYVFFDPARQQWLVHDTTSNQWRPL